jgi:hypothetical protein
MKSIPSLAAFALLLAGTSFAQDSSSVKADRQKLKAAREARHQEMKTDNDAVKTLREKLLKDRKAHDTAAVRADREALKQDREKRKADRASADTAVHQDRAQLRKDREARRAAHQAQQAQPSGTAK